MSVLLLFVPAFTCAGAAAASERRHKRAGELLRLSRRPDQVPSARAQVLMAACGLRLRTADTLLMLLPLTRVPSYGGWFRRSVYMLNMKPVPRMNVPAASPPRLSPASRPAYLKANPSHLGLHNIMDDLDALKDSVFDDLSCAAVLAALPKTLLAAVREQHGGVLTSSLWDVARMACLAASGTPEDASGVFVEAETWRVMSCTSA